jgi:outer membrane protein assembly factor BamB
MPNRLRRRVPPIYPPPAGEAARSRRRPIYVVRRNQTAEVLTIAVLVAAFILLGLGLMLWALEARVALRPTPTPTPTRGPAPTATVDFRATRVVEDFLTQQAYQAALLGTPVPPALPLTATTPGALAPSGITATATAIVALLPGIIVSTARPPTPTPPAEVAIPPTATVAPAVTLPTTSVVSLPVLGGVSPLPAPTPTAPPVVPPTIPPTLPPALPTDTPTATPPPLPLAPTDTPTLVLPPTVVPPTPTFTPPPTTIPYLVTSLRAFTGDQPVPAYLGPSTIYTRTATLAANTEIRLLGRNASGEWVYSCCFNNEPAWVRQVYAQPRDNTLGPGAPEGANANDVRWLALQPVSSILQPLPVPTPIPEGDYPLYRYARDAAGRLPRLPQPPVSFGWPATAQAAQALISPVTVAGSSVLVGSADNHLYSFDRVNGNQRWRYDVGQPVRQAPMVLDGEIFIADDTGRLFMFEDHGNQAALIWGPMGVNLPAVTSFNIYSDTLFIGVGQGVDYRLLALDRDNGALLDSFTITGSALRYPAVGDQLVYVAAGTLVALEVFNLDPVWTRTDLTNITAGPVYSTPGVRGLAELYIVDGTNRIFCLDANTGRELWNYDNGEPATGLAVANNSLIVSGNGYVKAITRDTLQQLWRAGTPGPVLGGAWTDGSRVLAITQAGMLLFVDATNGATLPSATIPAPAGGAGAVSDPWIFVPGADGVLYALRETQ